MITWFSGDFLAWWWSKVGKKAVRAQRTNSYAEKRLVEHPPNSVGTCGPERKSYGAVCQKRQTKKAIAHGTHPDVKRKKRLKGKTKRRSEHFTKRRVCWDD